MCALKRWYIKIVTTPIPHDFFYTPSSRKVQLPHLSRTYVSGKKCTDIDPPTETLSSAPDFHQLYSPNPIPSPVWSSAFSPSSRRRCSWPEQSWSARSWFSANIAGLPYLSCLHRYEFHCPMLLFKQLAHTECPQGITLGKCSFYWVENDDWQSGHLIYI